MVLINEGVRKLLHQDPGLDAQEYYAYVQQQHQERIRQIQRMQEERLQQMRQQLEQQRLQADLRQDVRLYKAYQRQQELKQDTTLYKEAQKQLQRAESLERLGDAVTPQPTRSLSMSRSELKRTVPPVRVTEEDVLLGHQMTFGALSAYAKTQPGLVGAGLSFAGGFIEGATAIMSPATYIGLYKLVSDPGKTLTSVAESVAKDPLHEVPRLIGSMAGGYALFKGINKVVFGGGETVVTTGDDVIMSKTYTRGSVTVSEGHGTVAGLPSSEIFWHSPKGGLGSLKVGSSSSFFGVVRQKGIHLSDLTVEKVLGYVRSGDKGVWIKGGSYAFKDTKWVGGGLVNVGDVIKSGQVATIRWADFLTASAPNEPVGGGLASIVSVPSLTGLTPWKPGLVVGEVSSGVRGLSAAGAILGAGPAAATSSSEPRTLDVGGVKVSVRSDSRSGLLGILEGFGTKQPSQQRPQPPPAEDTRKAEEPLTTPLPTMTPPKPATTPKAVKLFETPKIRDDLLPSITEVTDVRPHTETDIDRSVRQVLQVSLKQKGGLATPPPTPPHATTKHESKRALPLDLTTLELMPPRRRRGREKKARSLNILADPLKAALKVGTNLDKVLW